MRALAPLDAAAIARRPARRQPGKLQARPYFVLSCCFSTRRKEMSEQTRHATPNLLISIHILWLLISSLLHSLSTRLPPSPHFASPRSLYLSFSLFFIFYPLQLVLLFCNSFLCLSSIRVVPFASSSSSSLVSLSAGFCPRFFFPLHFFSSPFHLPSNILP